MQVNWTHFLTKPSGYPQATGVYSLPSDQYLDSSLEFREQPNSGLTATTVTSSPPIKHFAFSKRKATIVSAVITFLVILLTGASMLLLARRAPDDQQAAIPEIKTQDITIKNTASRNLPPELQGAEESLLVNGDIISRGTLKVTSGAYVSILNHKCLLVIRRIPCQMLPAPSV